MEKICNGQNQKQIILTWIVRAINKVVKKQKHKMFGDFNCFSVLAYSLHIIFAIYSHFITSTKTKTILLSKPESKSTRNILLAIFLSIRSENDSAKRSTSDTSFKNIHVFRPFQLQQKEKTNRGYKHINKVSHGIFNLTFRMLQHTSSEVTVGALS